MSAAVVAMNAAQIAYKKAISKTRKAIAEGGGKSQPAWLKEFANRLPEEGELDCVPEIKDKVALRKKALGDGESEKTYEQLAFWIYTNIVSQNAFETFILLNILLVGIATGVDLENPEPTKAIASFIAVTSAMTTIIFAMECVLKLVSYGFNPKEYFTDEEDGGFNSFDFAIVVTGFCFIGNADGSAIGALRLLRLLRLLTFIKGVPQLRVIVSGLLSGAKSVSYIVILLFLVNYLFSIMGCLFFGINDTARFGTVPSSMMSLFQVSTLASWTSIAYTSMFGCRSYQQDPYNGMNVPDANGIWTEDAHPSRIFTRMGQFQGFRCDDNLPKPGLTFAFFSIYIVLTSWVIMSLFIGVISMGMFDALEKMKADTKQQRYQKKLAEVSNMQSDSFHESSRRKSVFDRIIGDKGRRGQELSGKAKLKMLIDLALEAEIINLERTKWEHDYMTIAKRCANIEKSNYFSTLITTTIVVVGIFIGIETDSAMSCKRFALLGYGEEGNPDSEHCSVSVESFIVAILSQVIFTSEAMIKIAAQGMAPAKYFDDAWNKLDFFVVCVGFIEMSDASFLFEAFPVVILRLLRLLRVFRLAKALPRLRSIVEALISGFSAVGWICVLIVVFNYIIGCGCMLLMAGNDPFHFGSVGRSVFTVLRLETGDNWDQVLLVNMYGCEGYPGAYPIVDPSIYPNMECDANLALGWMSALVFFVTIILGTFVLPTVLIGIVVISFDEASRRASTVDEMIQKTKIAVADAKSQMPDFFTEHRFERMQAVFEEMDADGELSLDINEMTPFYEYVFEHLFSVKLTKEQQEQVFHLMDVDGDTELGFAEFVMFLCVVKQIEEKALTDPEFSKRAFPSDFSRRISTNSSRASKLSPGPTAANIAVDDAKGRVPRVSSFNDGNGERAQGSPPMIATDRTGDQDRPLRDVISACVDVRRILHRLESECNWDGAVITDEIFKRLAANLVSAASSIAAFPVSLPAPGGSNTEHGGAPCRQSSAPNEVQSSSPGSKDHATATAENFGAQHRQEDAMTFDATTTEYGVRIDSSFIQGPDDGAGGNIASGSSGGIANDAETGWTALLLKVHEDPEAFVRSIDTLYQISNKKYDDGAFDVLEMAQGLASLGASPHMNVGTALLHDVNRNGNGSRTISADDFESAIDERCRGFAEVAVWSRVLRLADQNPPAFIQSIDMIFKAFDTNNNGNIDIKDLAHGLSALGVRMNQEQMVAFHQDINPDKTNPTVTRNEVVDAVIARRPELKQFARPDGLDPAQAVALEEAWTRILRCRDEDPKVWERSVHILFLSFDRAGDGHIDVKDLASGLTSFGVRLNPQQLAAFYRGLDTNNNGKITLHDFMRKVEEQAGLQIKSNVTSGEQKSPPQTSEDGVWLTYSKTRTKWEQPPPVTKPERTPSLSKLLNESQAIFGGEQQQQQQQQQRQLQGRYQGAQYPPPDTRKYQHSGNGIAKGRVYTSPPPTETFMRVRSWSKDSTY